MREAVTRANTIVSGLLQLSAQSDFELKTEDLNSSIKRALRLINAQAVASKVKVARNLDAQLPRVRVDRVKIEQVFINLFLNAVQAMPTGGVLSVSTRAVQFEDGFKPSGSEFYPFSSGDLVVVAEVEDQGAGISEANLPKIFDPFFTTKAPSGGSGLGLSVVKKIVDMHGGAIHIRNVPQGGVVAELMLRSEREERLPPPKKGC
jgi:signal transduction histidine kinase